MIYLYTLPGITFSYPDIKNILYSTYLKNNKVNYKMYDYTDYFLNNLLVNANFEKFGEDIEKIKYDIKDSSKDLLSANHKFIEAVNKYLSQFGIIYQNNRGFNFQYPIKNIDDFIIVSNKIKNFIELFPLDDFHDKDIIFVNVSYGFQVPMAIALSNRIKCVNKNVKIIWGGNYLTQINRNCDELINKGDFVNAIIIFNHLKTFQNAISYCLGKNADLINIIVKNKTWFIEKNILDNVENYFLDYSSVSLEKYLSRDRIMPLLLNYGCYYHRCKFCSHYYHYGNYMPMNVKKIFKMVKEMYNNNRFDKIVFVDECIPPNIILDFANYLISNKINICWMMETRISEVYLDIDNVKQLAKSGCTFVSFGIESYNKRILKHMNKGIDIKSIKGVLKNFYISGIVVASTFMIGYPNEYYINIYKTLYFISHFKYIDLFGLNVFVLSRNSQICDEIDCDCSNINITYRFYGDKREKMEAIIKKINQNKKVCQVNRIKSDLLNRCDYFYLKRKDFSINYKEV